MRIGMILFALIGMSFSFVGAQGIGPGAAVPAVASLHGVNGTYWQSDVIVQNPGETETSVRFLLFPEIQGGAQVFEPMTSASFSIPAHGQLRKTNVVQSVFGRFDKKGALQVISEDGANVVVASRTYTSDVSDGTYGQEVFGVLSKGRAYAAGLENDSLFRTNIGIFVPIPPLAPQVLSFELVFRDDDGQEIGRETIEFPAEGMIQRSLSGIVGDAVSSASVEVVCSDSDAIWYGYISRVDQVSGDPVFRPLRGEAF